MFPARSTPAPGRPVGVGESLGAVLVAHRTDRGLSQLRLAAMLCAAAGVPTVTRHEISRWEREDRIPTRFWLTWLAVVLDVPLDELEPAAALARQRRATAAIAAIRGGHATPVEPDPTGLRHRIIELRRMDDLVGGAELAPLVRVELATARTVLADRYPAIIADLAQLTSWIAADGGDALAQRRAHRIGVQAAKAAGDRPLVGHLLSSQAQLIAEAGDPRRALSLANAARSQAATSSTPTGQALLWHRIAFAAAGAGDRRRCDIALHRAERDFDRGVGATQPSWLYWLDEDHLAGLTGRSLALTGQTRSARALLGSALAGTSPGPRARAVFSCALAGIAALAGQLDEAADLARQALLTAVALGSIRVLTLVRALDPILLVGSADPAIASYARLRSAVGPYVPQGAGPPRCQLHSNTS